MMLCGGVTAGAGVRSIPSVPVVADVPFAFGVPAVPFELAAPVERLIWLLEFALGLFGVTGEPGAGLVLPTPPLLLLPLEPLPPPMVAPPTDPLPPTVPLPPIDPPPTWALATAVDRTSADAVATVICLKDIFLKDMGLSFLWGYNDPTIKSPACFPLPAK